MIKIFLAIFLSLFTLSAVAPDCAFAADLTTTSSKKKATKAEKREARKAKKAEKKKAKKAKKAEAKKAKEKAPVEVPAAEEEAPVEAGE